MRRLAIYVGLFIGFALPPTSHAGFDEVCARLFFAQPDGSGLSRLDSAILKFIDGRPNRQAYGLEIKRAMIREGFWSVRFGATYPTLYALEERRLIVSAPEDDGPAEDVEIKRRIYKVTPNGRRAMNAVSPLELKEWSPLTPTVFP